MMQVKLLSLLLWISLFSALVISCKKTGIIEKNNSSQLTGKPGGQSSPQSYQISTDDYNLLKTVFATNDKKLIDSAKNAIRLRCKVNNRSGSSITARTTNLSTDEQEENDNSWISGDGTDYFYDPLAHYNGDYDLDPWGGGISNKYINFVKMQGFFSRRGNTLYVVLPFTYFESGGGAFKDPAGYFNTYVPRIYVSGNFLGDIDPNYYLTWNIQNPSKQNNPVDGNSEGGIMETRTVLKTADGRIKLVSSVNGAVVEVGAEVEAGFTVSSKYNSTSYYQYTAFFNITITTFYEFPRIHYDLAGTCTGIQIN